MGKTSSTATHRKAQADEVRLAKSTGKDIASTVKGKATKTSDSMINFMAKLGLGADNLLSAGSYGFNPITRNRVLLEWIHRGSWIGGVAIDVVADDMTRAGVDIVGELEGPDRDKIAEAATRLDVWGALNDNVKWSRLYGGSIAVHLIAGQDYATPLRVETIGKGQYKGLFTLDRWMVDPTVDNLVTEEGPFLGTPKYYKVSTGAPGLRGKLIHYSRVIRLEGIRLPYWQRVMENLWGESEIERVYDRLIGFDSATTGAAQLIFKVHLRTYKIKDLRAISVMGGDAQLGLIGQIEMMRRFQSSEGITLLDTDDEFETQPPPSISGLAETLVHFGQQISGALQIPLVRLFGQSPSGLNSSGESDLKTYYDGILQKQKRHLFHGVSILYRMLAASEGIKIPDGFGIEFRSLWQLEEGEKSEIAQRDTQTFTAAVEAGVVTPATAMREMRNSSRATGRWSSITAAIIQEADDMDQVPTATQVEAAEVKAGEDPGEEEGGGGGKGGGPSPRSEKAPTGTGDAAWEESQHERKNNGEFGTGTVASKGSSKKKEVKALYHSNTAPEYKLKVVKTPVYTGQPVDTKKRYTKVETGRISEGVALSWLKKVGGMKDAKPVNDEAANFAIDMTAGNLAVEVKGGTVYNGTTAQQWRATIGEPGKAEKAWLATASKEEKKALNLKKQALIIERKEAARKVCEKKKGREMRGATIATILNPDTGTADLFVFKGFHLRITWNSDEAKKAYKGTYAYST